MPAGAGQNCNAPGCLTLTLRASAGLNAPISFWSNGQPQTGCVLRLFLPMHPGNLFGPPRTDYVEYNLTEATYQATVMAPGATPILDR